MRYKDLSTLGIKYPDLCWDILSFFSNSMIPSRHQIGVQKYLGDKYLSPFIKNAIDFFVTFSNKYTDIDESIQLQPQTISKICEILCEHDFLTKIIIPTIPVSFGESFYYRLDSIPNDIRIKRYINNIVFGFKYIYETNKQNVLPIYVYNQETNLQGIGTCVQTSRGIITAKHCINDQTHICIPGIDLQTLETSKIKTNKDLDLILIAPTSGYNFNDKLLLDEGKILDNIMVMGYPKHTGFDNFLTATSGQIAGISQSHLCKYKTLLLTGKIKGGNSGGPVLNEKGNIVGFITENAEPEGDYDKFGYGLAILSSYISKLTENYEKTFNFVENLSF